MYKKFSIGSLFVYYSLCEEIKIISYDNKTKERKKTNDPVESCPT